MDYEHFKSYIKENICTVMEGYDSADVAITEVIKNNNVKLDALTIINTQTNKAPNIYLNKYFYQYIEGDTMSTIIMDIAEKCKNNSPEINLGSIDLGRYGAMYDRIILRVINYENNKELLEKAPYIPFLDLAITFRLLLHRDKKGIGSSLISYKEFQTWNISIEDMYENALKNTQKYFPCEIETVKSVVENLITGLNHNGLQFDGVEDVLFKSFSGTKGTQKELCNDIYQMTNTSKINGATCMLYEEELEKFAKIIGENFYILPSSIHEVIMIPDVQNINVHALREIVKEANASVVTIQEELSDNVYYYDKKYKQISLTK